MVRFFPLLAKAVGSAPPFLGNCPGDSDFGGGPHRLGSGFFFPPAWEWFAIFFFFMDVRF